MWITGPPVALTARSSSDTRAGIWCSNLTTMQKEKGHGGNNDCDVRPKWCVDVLRLQLTSTSDESDSPHQKGALASHHCSIKGRRLTDGVRSVSARGRWDGGAWEEVVGVCRKADVFEDQREAGETSPKWGRGWARWVNASDICFQMQAYHL